MGSAPSDHEAVDTLGHFPSLRLPAVRVEDEAFRRWRTAPEALARLPAGRDDAGHAFAVVPAVFGGGFGWGHGLARSGLRGGPRAAAIVKLIVGACGPAGGLAAQRIELLVGPGGGSHDVVHVVDRRPRGWVQRQRDRSGLVLDVQFHGALFLPSIPRGTPVARGRARNRHALADAPRASSLGCGRVHPPTWRRW